MQQIHFLKTVQHQFFAELEIEPEIEFAHTHPPGERHLNLMALENCLCEGNKYLRTHYAHGKFKQNYSGMNTGASDTYLLRYVPHHIKP
jgi:hypothetical protein